MKKFKYKNIVEIKVDPEATQKNYERLDSYSKFVSQKYLDEAAQNYLNERDEIFSDSLSEFLKKLGIDFKKDNEYVYY